MPGCVAHARHRRHAAITNRISRGFFQVIKQRDDTEGRMRKVFSSSDLGPSMSTESAGRDPEIPPESIDFQA
jgi:hypothetical protein